jgi:outer membrane protein OmpA-like peptidoglycan-associated protein
MKKLLFALPLLVCLLVVQQSVAQTKQAKVKKKILLEKAMHYDSLFIFDTAVKYYAKFQSKNPGNYYATNRVGDIYRLLGRNEEAAEYYAKAVSLPEATPDVYYHYAQTLRFLGKYEEAKANYDKYAELRPDDVRTRKILDGLSNINSYFKDTARYGIVNIDINTSNSDISPTWFKNDGIAYVSAGTKTGKIDNRWAGGQVFYDIFYADYDSVTKKLGEAKSFEGKIISNYHEGPMAFDSTFNKIIFTRNNFLKRTKTSETGIMKLNLFESTISSENAWGKSTRLPFDSPEYSCGHPTLTKDGKFLIFASDMPGGKGGQDLYYSEYDGGSWSNPISLGDEINTEGDEVFPFLHEDGTLYFASDGLAGLGGLDVYEAKKVADKQWANPKNFGAPINTSYDDFGLIYNKEVTAGYFTSNRPGGKGDDDIYYFDNQRFYINILVFDNFTGKPIESVVVKQILSADTLQTTTTSSFGTTEMKVQYGSEFDLRAFKEGYRSKSVKVSTSGMTPNDTVKIGLGLVLEAIVVDSKTKLPLSEAEVSLFYKADKRDKEEPKKFTTGENGKIFSQLTKEGEYKVTADKYGYFLSSEVNFSTNSYPESQDTIKVTLELNYLGAGEIVKLENIYYDYDKYNIRKDAAEELDRLIEILNKYPKMEIEMRSHTDSRGSDSYNLTLSHNRAMSAAKYLDKKGISKNRIEFKGYGETMHVNHCSNNVDCSEEEHQLNRRTEFKVLVQPDGTNVKGTIE